MIDAAYDATELAGLVARASSRGVVLDLVDAAPDARGQWRNRTYRLHLQALDPAALHEKRLCPFLKK